MGSSSATARQTVKEASANLSDFLTFDEVAARMGVSTLTVRHRVMQGYLHPVKGSKPHPSGRARNPYTMLFNPAEVDSEIQRAQEIQETRRGYTLQGPQQGSSLNPNRKSSNRVVSENSSTTAKVKISREFVDNVSASMADGKKCAEAVRLFRAGKSMLDIIEALEIDFETSKYFWQSYLECQPSWVLSPKDLARVRSILDWREDPPTVEGFNQALNKCMTEAPERTSLMSNKESDAIDAALANLDNSEKDDE